MSFAAFKRKLKNKYREFVGVRLTYLSKDRPFSLQQIKLSQVRVFSARLASAFERRSRESEGKCIYYAYCGTNEC